MEGFGRLRALNAVVGFAVAAAMLCASAGTAAAAPPTIAQKKAQQQATAAELEETRSQLAIKVAEYVELSRQLDRIRQQVDEVTAEITEADTRLDAAEEAVTRRAVQLYRSDHVDLFSVLLTSSSLSELMDRTYYLVMLGAHDADLISETRLARAESLWLQESLDLRVQRLETLQQDADDQREAIEKEMAAQEKKAKSIGADIARLVEAQKAAQAAQTGSSGSEPTGRFNADTVISEAVFRDWDSMTAQDIQAFLDGQPGTLKSYRAKNHAGRTASTAEMIAEAARVWHINPRVILVKLQKEQSLLADRSPKRSQYDWAMGCGKADSRTFYQYQGFGNQIYWGAQKLDKNSRPWRPGISMRIDGSRIHPTNSATYSLYKYTPHFRGTMSFWMLYWRYFGDPLATAAPAQP